MAKGVRLKMTDARNLLNKLRKEAQAREESNNPNEFQKARNKVKQEVEEYLKEFDEKLIKLERQLQPTQSSDGTSDQEKTADQLLGALGSLNRWGNWATIVYGMTIPLQTLATLGGKPDPKFIEDLGHNTIRIAKHMSNLFDKPDIAIKEKVWSVFKGFCFACVDYCVGGIKGAIKGYKEADGFFAGLQGSVTGGISGAVSGAFKGFADGLNQKDHLDHVIRDIRAKHNYDLGNIEKDLAKAEQEQASGTNPSEIIAKSEILKARKDVILQERGYLNQLENQYNKNPDDKANISKVLGSLQVLDWTNAGSSILHGFLNFFMRNKVYAGEAKAIGEAILNTAKSYNQLLDDTSLGKVEKIGIAIKAYANALWEGFKGMFTGFAKGAEHGLTGALSGIFVGGWSKFWQGFADSYKEQLGTKKEEQQLQKVDDDDEMVALTALGGPTDLTKLESRQSSSTQTEQIKNPYDGDDFEPGVGYSS